MIGRAIAFGASSCTVAPPKQVKILTPSFMFLLRELCYFAPARARAPARSMPMPTEREDDKRPATKAEKIEQLMGVIWEVEESDKLRAFAEKILRWAEIGESETAIRQQLGDYHVREFGKSPNKGDNDRIIEWLKKAVAGNLES
jgi:hypothetical protein